MAEIKVTDRDGAVHIVQVPEGGVLMETLRDGGTGVEGTCGGMCSCGTCHVYVDQEWADRLPPRGEDEAMMLEALGEFVELRPNSRLACQVTVDESLSGMTLEIAPEA